MKLLLFAFSLLILMQATSAPPLAAIETINALDFWLFRLLYNMVGYATMAVPAFFIIRHLRKIKYNETGNDVNCISFLYFKNITLFYKSLSLLSVNVYFQFHISLYAHFY